MKIYWLLAIERVKERFFDGTNYSNQIRSDSESKNFIRLSTQLPYNDPAIENCERADLRLVVVTEETSKCEFSFFFFFFSFYSFPAASERETPKALRSLTLERRARAAAALCTRVTVILHCL